MHETVGFKQRFFSQFFPTPRFLEMPVVGLDISDSALSAVELVRHHRGLTLGRYARRLLPPGSISEGYVNNRDAVIEELRKLKNALNLDFVNVSLPEEKAYLFRTQIPNVPRKEMRGALEFKIEESAPVSAHEAVFDYAVLTPPEHEAPVHLDVAMTVFPSKVVETYLELLNSADLIPLSFEIEAQAIARSVITRGDGDTYMIVNFGAQKTGLFIVSHEVVQFTSTVAIGGVHITEAISKHLSISLQEAEKIKNEHTVFRHKKHEDLFMALMNAVSALKDEIQKLSLYWDSHKEQGEEPTKKITKIILSGRDAGLTCFAEYLGMSLQSSVAVGNVWSNVFSLEDGIPPILFDESLDYAGAIGLALPKN